MVAIFVSNGTMCCLPLFINFSSNFFITTFYICNRVLQMKLTSMSMPLFIIHLLQSSSDEANSAVKELSRAVEELQKLLKESAEGTVLTKCFSLSLCLVICHCFVTGYYCECGWNISKLNLILYRNTLTGSFVIY